MSATHNESLRMLSRISSGIAKKTDFIRDDSGFDVAWVYAHAPLWIRKFPRTAGVRAIAFFRVYRSIERVPRGRKPWAVDNIRVGGDYPSLTAAKNAIRAEA